ncbi:MAG TPA: type II secretion system F family protein [Candidatus Baltobacteraceae bacterium]|nr:type II secretion system F family protein [Candidatus Baltobacteraceae bacterium]
MNAVTIMTIIAILGAATMFTLVFYFLPRESTVASRISDLSSGGKTFGTGNAIEQVFRNHDKGLLQERLVRAGMYDVTPAQLITQSLYYGLGVFGTLIAVLYFVHQLDLLYVDGAVLFALLAAYTPFSRLAPAAKKRKSEIARALPDLLDMVSSTVHAGLALNAAFAYAAPSTSGALGEELRSALSEMRVGRSRAEALRAMADRVDQDDLRTTVRAIIQADKLGSNLSDMLENLANDSRQARILRAEEEAAKLSVKMILPMAFFMLPALFAVIFGAVAANYFAK